MPTKHTFETLMRRLARIGFKRDFVRTAILPEWWGDSDDVDESVLPDIEIRAARFLNCSIEALRNPGASLTIPKCPGAQLRRVGSIDHARLDPAIYASLQIAGAVLRNVRGAFSSVSIPPADGGAWRTALTKSKSVVKLPALLEELWHRGIPVVPVDILPSPNFQGAAVMVGDRPVIIVGHRHDAPGKISFVVTHEAAHVASGDCTIDRPVIDVDGEAPDSAAMEEKADRFANQVLVGADVPPLVRARNYRELAETASKIERETGAEATGIIHRWAAQHADFQTEGLALAALYRSMGGRKTLKEYLMRHVDTSVATESDRALLRCIDGEPARDAAIA